jgi:hypothetical protein
MLPTMRFPIILTVAFLYALPAAAAPSQLPLFGTWKLNLAKSSYDPGPPPYKRSTCRIEPWQDGLRVSYDMVGLRGGVTHLEWTGKLDGHDYPLEGVDEVLSNAYTPIDDHTYDIVVKVDGRPAATARIVIAPDGRTLTTLTTTRNSQGQILKTTTVYDRL